MQENKEPQPTSPDASGEPLTCPEGGDPRTCPDHLVPPPVDDARLTDKELDEAYWDDKHVWPRNRSESHRRVADAATVKTAAHMQEKVDSMTKGILLAQTALTEMSLKVDAAEETVSKRLIKSWKGSIREAHQRTADVETALEAAQAEVAQYKELAGHDLRRGSEAMLAKIQAERERDAAQETSKNLAAELRAVINCMESGMNTTVKMQAETVLDEHDSGIM